MKKAAFLILLFSGLRLVAQTQGYLDINNVKAIIMNRNDMFWNLQTSNAEYEVPKFSGKNCAFASSVWVGGLDGGGQLHMAGMTYRQNGVDFWPGPLDTLSGGIDSTTSSQYNRIWKLTSNDINSFLQAYASGSVTANTFTPAADILSWPANGITNSGYSKHLAPFVDVNLDGDYNPMHGDYPKIKGDQMIFYVCNDAYGLHTETKGMPLGIEMQVSAYAYGCPSVLASNPALNNATFYHFKIINRSPIQYNNAMMGIWADPDIGNYLDDYVGCDTLKNIGYAYNADNFDENANGYGNFPPLSSYQVLKGPAAPTNDNKDNNHNGIIDEAGEDFRFNRFMHYTNNIGAHPYATTNPDSTSEYYGYMNAIWKDNKSLRADSSGYLKGVSAPVTRYAFPGNPQNNLGWTEFTKNNLKGDRKIVIGNGSFTMLPGSSHELEYSILTTFDSTANGHKNVTKMLAQNAVLKSFYDLVNKPLCSTPIPVSLTELSQQAVPIQLWPNPANDYVYLSSATPLIGKLVVIRNSMGQIVNEDKMKTERTKIDISSLAPGLYFVEISGSGVQGRTKLIKQ